MPQGVVQDPRAAGRVPQLPQVASRAGRVLGSGLGMHARGREGKTRDGVELGKAELWRSLNKSSADPPGGSGAGGPFAVVLSWQNAGGPLLSC